MRIFSSGTNSEFRGVVDDELAAGKSLADVIVGLAFERERHALGEKRAETLPRAAGELNADRVVGQARGTVTPRDFAAQHRADRAVNVANRNAQRNRRAILERLVRHFDQLAGRALRPGRDPAPACSGAPRGSASAGCKAPPKDRCPSPSSA